MKFEDLKVGMKIRAVDNYYNVTRKKYQYEGEVTDIDEDDETFTAKTTHSIYPDLELRHYVWNDLEAEHFEIIPAKKREIATVNEVLKVIRKKDTYYVIYNGKTVASATCSKDDNFNEEFGLNLALRRFCKTLCDENTTKKVVYNTDKVEDFI
nr:MAG TPA: hypothetical protein [Caudoviricetes sp.]